MIFFKSTNGFIRTTPTLSPSHKLLSSIKPRGLIPLQPIHPPKYKYYTTILSKDNDDINKEISIDTLVEDENDVLSQNSNLEPQFNSYTLNNELDFILHNSTMTPKVLKKAQEIFSQIQDPNSKSYILMIQIYGKCNQPQSAENLLHNMLTDYLNDDEKNSKDRIKPNKITFTSAIDAWSQSSNPKAAYKAQQLLEQMMQLYHDTSNPFGKEITPNSITFDTVLHAFSKTKNQARNAEAILEKMDYLRRNSDWDVKPNVISFTNVVNAWAVQEGKNAQRAQEVMERMEELYIDTKDKDLRLNSIIMNSVMDAWAKESNWQKALAILLRMEELYEQSPKHMRQNNQNNPGEIVVPNNISYNIALKALVNAKQIDKALTLFLKTQTFTEPDRMPNTRTYNTMLSAFSSHHAASGDGDTAASKAAQILAKQIASYKEGNKNVKPDTISFTTCMNAIAKSKTYPHKAKKTKEILDAMWDLYRSDPTNNQDCYPNVITYNTILNAAAFSAFTEEAEKQEAFLVALSSFNELRSSDNTIEPDEVTYGNMLKVCANLLPRSHPQRNNMGKQLWKNACDSGLVGDLVWNEVKRAIPMKLFVELIPPNVSGRKDLPWEWRQNVKVEIIENKKWKNKNKNKAGDGSARKKRGGRGGGGGSGTKPRQNKKEGTQLERTSNSPVTRFSESM